MPEIPDSVGQKVADFLMVNAHVLTRVGSVQACWRMHKGKRLGPYYRIMYRDRESGRQKMFHLGPDKTLANKITEFLRALQTPNRELRALVQLRRLACAALKSRQHDLDNELQQYGAYRKGAEIRRQRQIFCAYSSANNLQD